MTSCAFGSDGQSFNRIARCVPAQASLGGYGPPSGKPEAIGMYVQACAAHIDYIS